MFPVAKLCFQSITFVWSFSVSLHSRADFPKLYLTMSLLCFCSCICFFSPFFCSFWNSFSCISSLCLCISYFLRLYSSLSSISDLIASDIRTFIFSLFRINHVEVLFIMKGVYASIAMVYMFGFDFRIWSM